MLAKGQRVPRLEILVSYSQYTCLSMWVARPKSTEKNYV